MTLSKADIDLLFGPEPADSVESLLDAPITGEDISLAMQDPTFTPTQKDYLKFEEYSKTKQVDWINTIAQSVDAAANMIGGAISEGAQGAVINPLNYIEGAAQGTRQLYGLVAQSQDPSSPLFKFKDLVAGSGTVQSRYEQFLDARDFANRSAQLESGQDFLAIQPEFTNPQFVQGVSMILDPTLALPGIGEILGAGKLATKAVGKGAQLTGRAVAGVAKPLERFAGAAERIAAETIGTTPEALRSVASTAGIAGALGIAPEAAAFAAIPAGIRTAREAGEALARAGENLMTQPSRIGPLEAIGAAPGANMRQRMLGVIGQYGGDAAVDASLRGLAGGIEGAVIGTGLGYLSGGEEGAAAGLGSGGVQGAAGALGGRAYQKLTGEAAREARAGDLGRFIDGQQDPTTKALFERLRDTHGVDAASGLMDLQGLVRGKLGDVEVEYLSNEDFTKRYKISARGVQVDDKGGRPAVVINADIIGRGKGDGPLYTLGHELFHALEKSTQLQGGATDIKNALVGRWIQEGDTIRKLSEGAFSDAEIEARFNQYRDKLGAGNASMADELAQYDTINKKADYVASELAAEHFAGLLAGQKPDALLKGFTGLTRQLVDLALTQNASRALAEAAASIERTFGVKPTDSVLFPDLQKASPQVNAMLRDLLRARRKLDEKINIQDEKTKAVLKPEDVANPLAAKQLIELGLAEQMPDGTVRAMSTDEIVAREKKDQDSLNAIIENTPGNSRMVDGVALGRLSPNQLSAIEQSQTVSSRMKDMIRGMNATMDAGRSLNITYSAALKKMLNRLTGKQVNRYSSGIRLSDRDMLPYSFYFSKAANPVVKAIDISKVRDAILKDTASNGSVGKGLWDNVDGFMGDLAKYFTNLDQKEGARRSAEIFGLEKAQYLGDFVGAAGKGGSKFIRDFRLDRIGSMAPSGFRARFSEEAYQLSKNRWMPAEKLGDKSIINSEEGYRIISGAKHKLYSPDGKLIGIYDTQTQAERKADATQTRLQPEISQQQRPLGDEGRQAAEAGGRNRIERGQEGQGEGGAVRQAGDVRFMPAEEEAARKQVAEGLPRRASFEAPGVSRDQNGNIYFKGKEPKDWTPKEFEEYGKAFGVENLGPLSEITNIPSDVAGDPARIPGGLEGKFTYYDLLWLKTNPVDVANLPETTHAKLTAKLAATMAPTPGDKVSSFNSIVFGMLSPNAPLLPNEMGMARLRFGSMEDVRKFASLYPENPTKENLKELNQRLKKELGFISAGKGGLGIAITADISNIVNAARLFTKNPDFFVKKSNESWADFVDKLTTQIKGFGTKTGSFGSVWQDPLKASISAMDRHMARIFGQELLGNPELRKRFEGIVVDRFNSMLKKSKEATSAFNRRLKNAEEKGKRIEEINKDDPKTLKTLKAKNDKRIKSIKAEMASTLDSLPDPTATRAKTIDDVLGQAQIYGADRVQKFVNEAVFAAMGSRKATLIAKKGGINPNAPANIKSVEWVETPKDFQVMSDSYRSALEINERRANELGVAVFPAQWTLWDRIRGRVEPHEVMFPGLDKLPALNDRQLGEAQKANKAAGYGSTPEAGEKWKRKQIDSPSRLAYFMPAGEGEKLYEQGRPEQGGDRGGRIPRGSYTPLDGAPTVTGATGPAPGLVDVARSYAEAAGIPHRRQAVYVEVDEARARRIADAYEAMKHEPQNPKVKEAYADLIRQTKDQYQALVKAGYEFTFFDQFSDPYKGNPSAAMRDLRANKRMAVYGTYDGYGTEGITGAEIKDNPMLEPTGLTWPDQRGVMHPVVANDLFRAVHDAFGHGLEGASFRARGEENAWQAHVRLFTGPAIAAITSETRGQNSWLNYGPHGERNRTAKLEDTVFSTQKTGLMPDWTWNEGLAPDEGASVEGQRYMPAGAETSPKHYENVDSFREHWNALGVRNMTDIREKGTPYEHIRPSKIEVDKANRNKGLGTAFMEDLVAFADLTGKQIRINPSDELGATSKGRLEKFYKRFGFVENKPGKNKDYAISERFYRQPSSGERYMPMDENTGLPLNPDKTVTVYHHTNKTAAEAIRRTGMVKSAGEPDVYVTTEKSPTTGYGDEVVAINVDPKKLQIDDQFPDGRTDFRMSVGKPGGSMKVKVDAGVSFMPSDTDYLSAVRKGDTATAQRMVDEAAKAAGYLDASELSGPKYNEGDPVYHNTPSKFTVFEPGKNGLIQFTPSKTLFGKRGDIKVAAYLKEPVIRNSTGLILSVKDSSQVKLADPITKDDAGNVIPLSQRFKATSDDIRYMPQPDSAMPGAYSFPGGYRALPGKAKGSLRLYGPAGSLIGIASSLDEAQRILRRKNK
jgi:GNAT superfamily N-acetyltransferase